MFYSFELQMAGVILLTAMLAGGISLWLKRRKLEKESGWIFRTWCFWRYV